MAEDHSSLACQMKAMITNEGSKVHRSYAESDSVWKTRIRA